MAKLSVIIPSRNELFLPQTVDDLINKAAGEIEVVVTLDGYWPDPILPDYKELILVHHGGARGMRACINSAAQVATGEYLMKCDAHCMFAEGFDEVLKADCDKDWIVIPSRYSLDAENWAILQNRKSRIDYHYLSFPYAYPDYRDYDAGLHGAPWNDRARERKDDHQFDIDDEMSFQGSCWFMSSYHFKETLGGMSEEGYETFIQEPQEIGLKTWLGGGRIVSNKKTWYAHLHKGRQYGRGYYMSKREVTRGGHYSNDFWMNNRWTERKHDIEWLIERFWPVPTWPEDWREVIDFRRSNPDTIDGGYWADKGKK
ncbi:MAG: glycosyltransferase [Planctomycetota bacterium]|jgi:glycosyltransferase involved in cell wall biosynthesis